MINDKKDSWMQKDLGAAGPAEKPPRRPELSIDRIYQ